jgi:hypothetical protein
MRLQPIIGLVLLLGVASISSAHEAADETVAIPAKVVADPRHTISVVAPEDGRLLAPDGGFAVAGQRVRAGQLLAVLQPAYSQSERRDLGAELAAQQRDEYLNKLQMDRYQADGTRPFDIKLPTPTVQLVADYRSAHGQAAQLQRALKGGVPLFATEDAIVLRAPVRGGKTLSTGQLLFELRAIGGLAVSAEYTDGDFDADAPVAAITLAKVPLQLHFVGSSYDAVLRTHRVLYAMDDASTATQVGEPVRLVLRRNADAVVAATGGSPR